MTKKNINIISLIYKVRTYIEVRTFLFVIIFSFFASTTGTSQMFDSIGNSFTYKPKFLLKLDARNSFVANSFSKFNGVKLGLDFNNTTRIGIGYSWLKTENNFYLNNDSSTLYQLSFSYIAPFIEYKFYNAGNWSAEIPVQLGLGVAKYKNEADVIKRTWVFLYEPAMAVEYRFLKYFGIGGGVGLRLALKLNSEINENLSAPVYVVRFKIYFNDIYKEHIVKDDTKTSRSNINST